MTQAMTQPPVWPAAGGLPLMGRGLQLITVKSNQLGELVFFHQFFFLNAFLLDLFGRCQNVTLL